MKWWTRRRLRPKIFVPFAGLIVATLLSTLWLINSAVSYQVENSLRTQLVVTGEAFRGLVSDRARRLTADTLLLAADFALKRAIATYDPETLATVAVNYRERIDLELLWITDESGNLLGDASGRQRAARAISNLPPLHEAITQGHEAAALNELDGALFVFVAVPVFAPDPIGFLLAGAAIDDSAARAFEKQIGSAVTFATASRVFATSWPEAERAAFFPGGRLGAEALRHGDTGTFLVQRGDERLLSLLVPIESSLGTPLFALMQQPYDRALQPLHTLRRRVVLIGAAALVVALMVGALLAGSIAVPLRSECDHLAAAQELLLGEVQGKLLEGQERWASVTRKPSSNPNLTLVPSCVTAPAPIVGCMQQKRNIPRSSPPPTVKSARLELRPDRAFVLHLDVSAQLPRRVVGRVEHVTSGQVAHVASLGELMAFMAKVLRNQARGE